MNTLFVVFGLVTLPWAYVVPQAPQSKIQTPPRTAANVKPVSITGTSFDGKLFVNDEDMQIWNVTNSQVLKGHLGEHVRVIAQVDATKNAIVVKSLRVLPKTRKMPSNDDYRIRILPQPFPDYLRPHDPPPW